MKVSIIIPVYNNVSELPHLLNDISLLPSSSLSSVEIIIVDDGSKHYIWNLLTQIKENYPSRNITLVRMSKNQGQHLATFVGLNFCRYKHIITMDSDRRNRPEDILLLIKTAKHTKCDLAYGYFSIKKITLKYLFSYITKLLLHKIGNKVDIKASSFRYISKDLCIKTISYKFPFASIDTPLQELSKNSQLTEVYPNKVSNRSSYSLLKKSALALKFFSSAKPFYKTIIFLILSAIIFGLLVYGNEFFTINNHLFLLCLASSFMLLVTYFYQKRKIENIHNFISSVIK